MLNTPPIRVLHVIGIMNRGGAETMIMNLYRNMDRTKVQFDFVENCFEKAAFDEEIKLLGGKIYHCPHFNGKNYFRYKWWWKKFFDEHYKEYTIVHGHLGSTASVYLREAKKRGIYVIAHSHNTNAKNDFKQILYNFLSYRTRYIADYFFACSAQAGKDRFGTKVVLDKSHYSLLNNAISTELFQYNLTKRRKKRIELGVSEDEYIIGHVGRFMEQKNHDFLLKIYSAINKYSKNVRFLLVGDGPLKDVIIKKSVELKINNKIIFAGVRTDIPDLMQAMDIFVFPSKYEGLPVTLVEAQAAGLPCVISDRVPEDSIITKNLVSIMKISDSEDKWAEHILSRIVEKRVDHRSEVVDSGFDIKESAKKLEEFYLEKRKK